MNNGYIKLPRSLLNDPLWRSLPLTYRNVYLTILQYMAYKPLLLDDFGKLTLINPGQLLITERDLVKKCCSLEIDKSLVHRSLIKFEKLNFSNQKTNQRKTLITITRKDILELLEPEFEPNSNQTRTIKEQREQRKEVKEGNVAMGALNPIGTAALPFSKEKKKSKRLNEEQQETLEWLLSLELETDEAALRYWATNYPKTKIEDAYFFMLAENNKARLKNPAGFIRSILDGKIIPMDKNSIINKSYADKFRKAYPFLQLKIYEKYCKSLLNEDWEISFSISKDEFQNYLDAILEKSEAYV